MPSDNVVRKTCPARPDVQIDLVIDEGIGETVPQTKSSCPHCARTLKTCTHCVTYRHSEVQLLLWQQAHPQPAPKGAAAKVPSPNAQPACAMCNGNVGADGICGDCGNRSYRSS